MALQLARFLALILFSGLASCYFLHQTKESLIVPLLVVSAALCAVVWQFVPQQVKAASLRIRTSQPRVAEREAVQKTQPVTRSVAEAVSPTEAVNGQATGGADNLPISLLFTDEHGYLQNINQCAANLLGYHRNELQKKHASLLFPAFAEVRKESFLQTLQEKASSRLLELTVRRKDSSVVPVDVWVNADATAGGAMVISLLDATERKELERIKSEIISMVSHDLRSPLTTILTSMEMLAQGVHGPLNEPTLDLVHTTRRQTQRLMRLVNDILQIEKMQSGQFTLEFAEVPLLAIMDAAEEAVSGLARTQQVQIETNGPDVEIYVDGERIMQVLVNLLSNAIKFSHPHSVVTMSASESPPWLEIEVIDRGRGIPEAYKNLVFEKFRQVEKSDRRKYGGSGLGLPICRAIVEQHGGQIGFTSKENEGTTFWIKLPRFQ